MLLLQGHTEVVRILAFSPDCTRLATLGQDSSLRMWDLGKGTEIESTTCSSYAAPGISFSSDGRWLAIPFLTPAVWIWDAHHIDHQVKLSFSFENPSDAYVRNHVFRFTRDDKHLFAVGQRSSQRNIWRYEREEILLQQWETESWKEMQALHFEISSNISWRAPWAFFPEDMLLAIPDYTRLVFWSLATQEEKFHLPWPGGGEPAYNGLVFSPDGSRLAAARAGTLSVVDIKNRRVIASWKNATRKHFQSLAFSPCGQTLATVSNDTIARFWDTDTGKETAAYAWDIGPLKGIAFSPDGMRAAATGKKGTILVWDVD